MDWIVTYRGKSGSQEQVSLEAESREAVFKELSQRGLTAIRIEQANGKAKPRKASSKGGNKPSGVFKGALAGIIVVVAAVGAWYYLSQKQETAQPEPKTKKAVKIAEVTPAPATTNVTAQQPVVTSNETPAPVEKPLTVHDRLAKRKFGENNIVVTSKVQRVKSRYEIFKHRSENHLALLATIPMGATLVGSRRFDERFMRDLDAALSEKVEILPEDSEYDRNLKLSVEDLKDEIRKRKAAGEDIAQVLDETFKEIQKLGIYRQQIESMVRKTMREDKTLSDHDVDDLVGAANLMLEEKGIAPIKVNTTLRAIIRSTARVNEEGEK